MSDATVPRPADTPTSAPAPPEVPLGTRYVLGRRLGQGGMGAVFEARDRTTGGLVAAKVLLPALAGDAEVVGRFLQERTILMGVEHPNIVRVRDLVSDAGQLTIVMDLVTRGDLRDRLRAEGTLVPALAVTWMAEVLEALTVVHAAGVTHRDIKPENVLLDEGNRARVTDFGVARLAQGSRATQATSVIGTPEYLSPEALEHNQAIPSR